MNFQQFLNIGPKIFDFFSVGLLEVCTGPGRQMKDDFSNGPGRQQTGYKKGRRLEMCASRGQKVYMFTFKEFIFKSLVKVDKKKNDEVFKLADGQKINNEFYLVDNKFKCSKELSLSVFLRDYKQKTIDFFIIECVSQSLSSQSFHNQIYSYFL